jgi:hypothetical protein
MPGFRRPQLPPSLPPARPLFRSDGTPSYQQRLAVIGRYLDVHRCVAACLLEVADNYVVRALSEGASTPSLMEFIPEDFAGSSPDAPREPMVSTLLPAGYETTLGAVGRLLDERDALMITLIEGPSALHIIGSEGGHAGDHLVHLPFELTLDGWALQELIHASG